MMSRRTGSFKQTRLPLEQFAVEYSSKNPEELKDEPTLDFLNLISTLALKEAPNYIRERTLSIGRERGQAPPLFFTEDPGDLIDDEEVDKNEGEVMDGADGCGQSGGTQSPACEVHRESPSLIKPAPHWWERGPEVVSFIPPSPEEDYPALTKSELGFEFPLIMGNYIEETVREKWEEMRSKGIVGSIEESRTQYNSVLVQAQVNAAKFAMGFVERRSRPGAMGGRHRFEDVKEAARECLGRHYSDIESDDDDIISSSSSDSSPEPHPPSNTPHLPSRKPHPPSKRPRKLRKVASKPNLEKDLSGRHEAEDGGSSDEEVKSKSNQGVKHISGSSSKRSRTQISKRPRISKQTKQCEKLKKMKGTPRTQRSSHSQGLTLTTTETSPLATNIGVSSITPPSRRRSARLMLKSGVKDSGTKESDSSIIFTEFRRETNSKTKARTQTQQSKRKEDGKDELKELLSSSNEDSSWLESIPTDCSSDTEH